MPPQNTTATASTVPSGKRGNGRRGRVPRAFLTEDGRLPGFAQRRLDGLIAKKKKSRLTKDESRELKEALEYIDRKSMQLLAYEVATTQAGPVHSKRNRRAQISTR